MWHYVEHLRDIIAEQYEHIELSRLEDLVNIQLPAKLDEVTFVANATNFRRALMNEFGKDDMDVKEEIAKDENMRLSWCGHKRYLENDLRYIFPVSGKRTHNQARRDAKYLAGEMIKRSYVSHHFIRVLLIQLILIM